MKSNILLNCRRQRIASRIPGSLQRRIVNSQERSKTIDKLGLGISTHETHTSYQTFILPYQQVHAIGCQWHAFVFPQMGTVTALTAVGAIADIDGQSCFVGYFLKHYVVVIEFKHCFFRCVQRHFRPVHNISSQLQTAAAKRNC